MSLITDCLEQEGLTERQIQYCMKFCLGELNCDIHAPNNQGHTALYLAARYNLPSIIYFLDIRGAQDPDIFVDAGGVIRVIEAQNPAAGFLPDNMHNPINNPTYLDIFYPTTVMGLDPLLGELSVYCSAAAA